MHFYEYSKEEKWLLHNFPRACVCKFFYCYRLVLNYNSYTFPFFKRSKYIIYWDLQTSEIPLKYQKIPFKFFCCTYDIYITKNIIFFLIFKTLSIAYLCLIMVWSWPLVVCLMFRHGTDILAQSLLTPGSLFNV